jgi:hypothetical protein
MNDEDKSCPDCDGSMKSIRMVDKNIAHHDLVYTVPDAKRSFWNSKFPVEGTINGIMCESCGLIKLYGKARDE